MAFGEIKYRSWVIRFIFGGFVGIFLAALYLMNSPSRHEAVRSVPPAVTPVNVARVRRVISARELKVNGELLPVHTIEVSSRLAGKVLEVRVKAGDFVSAGMVVAVIDSRELDERIQRLEVAVAGTGRELQLREEHAAAADKRLIESRELLRRDLIARRDLEPIERAAETARAQADLARAYGAQQEAMAVQLRALRKFTRISAPRSGTVSRRLVEPGAVIGAGQAMLTLVNLEALKLAGKVSSDEAGALRHGMTAQVSAPAFPGKTSAGHVTRFGPAAKATEDPLEVQIHVENRENFFQPGMTVEARIDLGQQHEQLVVSRSAVKLENNQSYVYQVVDERVWRRRVTVGLEQGQEFVIVEGLHAGDAVVADPRENLEHGSRVRVLEEITEPSSDGR